MPDAGQVEPTPDSTEQAEAPSLPSDAQGPATESGDHDEATDTASGSVASDAEKVDEGVDAAGAADDDSQEDADQPAAQAPEQDVPAAVAEKALKEETASLINATCSVIGVDAQGNRQTWAAAQGFSLKEGATAATLTEELFKRTGLKADYNPNGSWGWALNAVSSPFEGGPTLSYDPVLGITGSCLSTAVLLRSARVAIPLRKAIPLFGLSPPSVIPLRPMTFRCRAKLSAKTLMVISRFGRSQPPSMCRRVPVRPI